MNKQITTIDANEAAAYVAYRVNEVIAIYPITPFLAHGEWADEWAAAGVKNLWGTVPSIQEMQSEGGAAGAVHGALQTGALTTTFTASQGFFLMIPNMYKIAGELTSSCSTSRPARWATHALSIFGDHSDVMSARATALPCSARTTSRKSWISPLISQAATHERACRFPALFDGFRTSHEVSKIEQHSNEVIPRDDRRGSRAGAPRPGPDARPAGPARHGPEPGRVLPGPRGHQPLLRCCAGIVKKAMDKFAKLTGRRYVSSSSTRVPRTPSA